MSFGILAKLSGGQEEAVMLSMNSGNIIFNFRELLFAGIVVASLGACMDVGMSIASALDELKQQKPTMTGKELFKSGMNIGRRCDWDNDQYTYSCLCRRSLKLNFIIYGM